MPELPEIEHLRRTLAPRIAGRRVVEVAVHRPDVVRDGRGRRGGRILRRDLLRGSRVADLARHGKQLAIVNETGRIICIHLGMSGQLRMAEPGERPSDDPHVHCTWTFDRGARLLFRDPRRFGGIWHFPSGAALRSARWDRLGPDALEVRPGLLRDRLAGSRRAIKAALLDQAVLAGLGNIYVDEALFAASIHPLRRADRLTGPAMDRLSAEIRRILEEAVAAGGSTIRDYVDAAGEDGDYALAHRVYGRAGRPCLTCGRVLRSFLIAQRTTVACSRCQPPPRQRSSSPR